MTDLPLVVIPARYASSRLPGKPLVPILGVPMLVRTWRRAAAWAGPDGVVVATDDDRVADLCREHAIRCVRTSSDHPTGTDRVAEVARKLGLDAVINVQGDEPLMAPEDIATIHRAASESGAAVVNGMCPVGGEEELLSRTVPKVVAAPDGRLLYMSRSPIPGRKDGFTRQARKQVCTYLFTAAALEAFSRSARTPLEREEDIEILRFVELGWPVHMVEVSDASIAVDVPADVTRVEAALRAGVRT